LVAVVVVGGGGVGCVGSYQFLLYGERTRCCGGKLLVQKTANGKNKHVTTGYSFFFFFFGSATTIKACTEISLVVLPKTAKTLIISKNDQK
jgi:hypothetical protein